jgi:menaquinol-cytochrome c reductase iron-sulfur subunit
MSDQNREQLQPSEEHSPGRREMSRRQFLSYTLGGTGAFMLSMPILWNLRFAVDPLLQPKAEADWVKVIPESEVSETPVSIKFQKHVVDGWYEHDPELEAWIARNVDGTIFALSPTCKHLGCRVEWNGSSQYPEQYYCPCHGAHYTKEGKNLAIAPAPLDQYDVKVEDGWVYLGQLTPNQLVK